MQLSAASLFLLALAGFATAAPAAHPRPQGANAHLQTRSNSKHGQWHDSFQWKHKNSPAILGSESKTLPRLKNGNLLISAFPSQMLKSDEPNLINPSAAPTATGGFQNDILRGILQYSPKTHQSEEWYQTVAVGFEVPHEARGLRCSFHFIFGIGDSLGTGKAHLFSLSKWGKYHEVEEYLSSWNRRPIRDQFVATFEILKGKSAAELFVPGRLDSADADFDLIQAGPIQDIRMDHHTGYESFPCDNIIGRSFWEIVASKDGWSRSSWAWSVNKGLLIEVHGLKAGPDPLANINTKNDDYDDDDEDW